MNFLDKETDAPGWKPKTYKADAWEQPTKEIESPEKHAEIPKSDFKVDGEKFKAALVSGLNAVIEKEPLITKYDTQVGDGDCGETLKNGATAILKRVESDKEFQQNLNDPVATLSVITEIVEDSMGGTSGGIYAIYLTSLVKNLQELKSADVSLVANALKNALYDGLFKYTKLAMVDVLLWILYNLLSISSPKLRISHCWSKLRKVAAKKLRTWKQNLDAHHM